MIKLQIFSPIILSLLFAGSVFADDKAASPVSNQSKVEFEIRLAKDQPEPGYYEMTYSTQPKTIYVSSEVELDNRDVISARVETTNHGGKIRYDIRANLTEEGSAKFTKLTADNVGGRIAILMDKKVVSAPRIAERIPGGNIPIFGDFSNEEAERIAKGLTP